jgi:hypothetical protein
MVQSRLVNKKVREENQNTQDKIREFLGQEAFDQLVKNQEEHYQQYFKFDEVEESTEATEVEADAEPIVEEINEEKDDK